MMRDIGRRDKIAGRTAAAAWHTTRVAEGLIHLCVLVFAVLMAQTGWEWLTLKWDGQTHAPACPRASDYFPLVISGALKSSCSSASALARADARQQ